MSDNKAKYTGGMLFALQHALKLQQAGSNAAVLEGEKRKVAMRSRQRASRMLQQAVSIVFQLGREVQDERKLESLCNQHDHNLLFFEGDSHRFSYFGSQGPLPKRVWTDPDHFEFCADTGTFEMQDSSYQMISPYDADLRKVTLEDVQGMTAFYGEEAGYLREFLINQRAVSFVSDLYAGKLDPQDPFVDGFMNHMLASMFGDKQ